MNESAVFVPRQRAVKTFLCAAVSVAALAASSGGYFPTTWNWAMLAFGWAAAMVLLIGRPERWTRAEIAALTARLTLAGWAGLSVLWTIDVTQTVLKL